MDNYSEKVNALGLTDSKSNYIKSLWKEHCRDIEGLYFMEDEGDHLLFGYSPGIDGVLGARQVNEGIPLHLRGLVRQGGSTTVL